MMLDKKAVNMLLTLDDARLAQVIKRIASDAGIDATNLNIGPSEIAGIRTALSSATDSDLSRAEELIKSFKSGKMSF